MGSLLGATGAALWAVAAAHKMPGKTKWRIAENLMAHGIYWGKTGSSMLVTAKCCHESALVVKHKRGARTSRGPATHNFRNFRTVWTGPNWYILRATLRPPAANYYGRRPGGAFFYSNSYAPHLLWWKSSRWTELAS